MTATEEQLQEGDRLYHQLCASCHGYQARGYRNADLRLMSTAVHDAFQKIVREGLLLDLGMGRLRRRTEQAGGRIGAAVHHFPSQHRSHRRGAAVTQSSTLPRAASLPIL